MAYKTPGWQHENPRTGLLSPAPFPGPGGEDAPDVWYDVRVEAHKSRVHAIAAQNLVVTVLPVGETLTRVDIDCKEVGRGSLVGRLDIDKTLTMM